MAEGEDQSERVFANNYLKNAKLSSPLELVGSLAM